MTKINHVTPEIYHAFGDVAMRWATVEYGLDSVIRAMIDHYEVDINTALILPFSKRTELFADLCRRFVSEPELLQEALDYVTAARRAQAKRDLIIHGVIQHCWKQGRGVTIEIHRFRWDRPVKVVERRKVTMKWLESVLKEIAALTNAWMPLEPRLTPWRSFALPPTLWPQDHEDPMSGFLANFQEYAHQLRSSQE